MMHEGIRRMKLLAKCIMFFGTLGRLALGVFPMSHRTEHFIDFVLYLLTPLILGGSL